MSSGIRRTWQVVLAASTLLLTADLTSRLAYSDAAIAARVETAVHQAFEELPELNAREADRVPPRLRVTVLR